MKRILILLIFNLILQNSFGQACGIYKIKYSGNINSESIKVEKIKLPTIQFLHGLEDETSKLGYVEIPAVSNELEIELGSHMTSHLYENPENLLKLYKTKRENIPITVIIIENGERQERRLELSWEDIEITKLEDDGFGNLFELNIHEITIE